MSEQPILHGNDARIDPGKQVIPRFLTNTIVAKKEQTGNKVPHPLPENIILAKEEVDANEK